MSVAAIPQVGEVAPDFTLSGTTGDVTLSALRGRKLLIAFYVLDFTGG